MEVSRLFSILKSFKWFLATGVTLYVLIGVGWHFVIPSKYLSRSFVYLDLSGLGNNAGNNIQGSTFAQTEIATSERVLIGALERIDSKTIATLVPINQLADKQAAVSAIRNAVLATVGRDSSVIQISALSRDANVSAAIANAVAESYLSVTLGLKNGPATQKASYYEARVAELEKSALSAQADVIAFQDKTGIVSTGSDRNDVDQAMLNELIKRTTDLRSQYLGSAAGRSEVSSKPNESAEVLTNNVVQALQIDVARAKSRLEELDTRLGRNHPQYQSATRELAQLQRNLDQEIAMAATAISTAGKSDTKSAEKLSQVVDKQKAVILDLSSKRQELAQLQQRADYARKNLEGMRDKLSDAIIESKSNIGATSLLAAANAPSSSTDAPLTRTVLLAVVLGFVSSSLGAIVFERWHPRLRTLRDVDELGPMVLAKIPRAPADLLNKLPAAQRVDGQSNMVPVDKRLGSLLLASGKLSKETLQTVYDEHVLSGEPFGAVAVRIGVISESDVYGALSTQYGLHRLTSHLDSTKSDSQFIVDRNPSHPVAEAIRVLRAQVRIKLEDKTVGNVLAITSANKGDGKSFVAANLAIACAQAGMRTILVEADMRDPQLASRFGSSRREGLSSYLADLSVIPKITPLDRSGYLYLLPAGPRPPNPQELLCSPSFPALLREMSLNYDIVIVDTPSDALGADAQVIASVARMALIVTRWNFTGIRTVNLLIRRLSYARVLNIGTVVNFCTSSPDV